MDFVLMEGEKDGRERTFRMLAFSGPRLSHFTTVLKEKLGTTQIDWRSTGGLIAAQSDAKKYPAQSFSLARMIEKGSAYPVVFGLWPCSVRYQPDAAARSEDDFSTARIRD